MREKNKPVGRYGQAPYIPVSEAREFTALLLRCAGRGAGWCPWHSRSARSMRTGVRRATRLIGPLSYTAVDHKRRCVYISGAADTVTSGPADTVTVVDWLTVTFCVTAIDKFITTPALTFVCTFMAHPPSGVVTFMVLVPGLWPLRSTVAMEVSL